MTDQTATEATKRDKGRRYLVPVGRLLLPSEPDYVHLSLYEWEPRSELWLTGLALCGRSTEQGALPEGTEVTCPNCPLYQDTYRAVLDREAGRAIPELGRSALASLPEQVRGAVRESGLKQKWIADRLHVSEKHLSQLLTGRVAMTPEWAERILGLCGMELVVSVRPRSGVGR
ncbi:transcriptional regulator [Streptomyces sp. NPDC008222]|uniref:helix-turn-helix transcriptional regulator n=1 Tax=Streptomyces sp. NPDC008222 TaxID=3364820 RepID=UPI0036EEB37F